MCALSSSYFLTKGVRKMSLESSENCADLRKRSSVILRSPEPGNELIPSQADNDDQLIELGCTVGQPPHNEPIGPIL